MSMSMPMPTNQAGSLPSQAGQPPLNSTVTNSVQQLLSQGFTSGQIMEELRRLEYENLAQQHAALTQQLQTLQVEYTATGQKLNEVNQALQALQAQQTEDTSYFEVLPGLVPSSALPS